MKTIAIEIIVAAFSIMFLSLYFLYRIFVKKGFVATEEQDKKKNVDSRITEWKHKHSKIFNIVFGIVLFAFLLPANILVVFPFWKDSKYIFANSYPEFEGTIISEVETSKKLGYSQDVIIENVINRERVKVNLEAGTAQQGDYIRVKYLPYTRIGAIEGERKKQ